ncbi:TPA: hypothetical protein OMS42_003651 [Enterobacter kobei]|nr:hypothetical protein [Enterobacter kobei]
MADQQRVVGAVVGVKAKLVALFSSTAVARMADDELNAAFSSAVRFITGRLLRALVPSVKECIYLPSTGLLKGEVVPPL